LTLFFLTGGLTGKKKKKKKKKGKNKIIRQTLDHSYTMWAKFLPARSSSGLVRAIVGMLFTDNDICQSLDCRFSEAGSFGACDQCNSSNHAIDVGCSGMDDFGQDDFGVVDFDRHCIDFGWSRHE
jgi:hypothetical protein